MRLTAAAILMGLGAILCLWGTLWLPGRKDLFWKVHALGVADTLGLALVVAGLLVRAPDQWPALTLALVSLVFWGTAIGYVLARGAYGRRPH
ncbi:MAG: monovalent cation/H(+) antiporter subunit G [Desulfococcaceae bacterium]